MVVSVPEKTLEHWASLYLTYRYRSHASLWWPVSGEDIHVGYFPARSGKAIQLELKTTTLNSAGDVHEVKISLWQLEKYLHRPHWERPFYVFPMPHWKDTLEVAATAAGLPVTEAGFSRSNFGASKPWWFAQWMVALTTDQVAQIMNAQLIRYRAGGTASAALVRYDLRTGRRVTTWGDAKPHRTIPWQTLWTRLDECGRSSWPQVVRVPWRLIEEREEVVRHSDLSSLLSNAAAMDGELVTLGSTGDGIFEPIEEGRGRDDVGADGPDDEQLEHRMAVFLGVDALRFT